MYAYYHDYYTINVGEMSNKSSIFAGIYLLYCLAGLKIKTGKARWKERQHKKSKWKVFLCI